MRLINHRTIYSSLFYGLAITLLMLVKPEVMFDNVGNVKQFGVGGDRKTIFSFGVANGVIALMSFYVFTLIDVVFASKNSV